MKVTNNISWCNTWVKTNSTSFTGMNVTTWSRLLLMPGAAWALQRKTRSLLLMIITSTLLISLLTVRRTTLRSLTMRVTHCIFRCRSVLCCTEMKTKKQLRLQTVQRARCLAQLSRCSASPATRLRRDSLFALSSQWRWSLLWMQRMTTLLIEWTLRLVNLFNKRRNLSHLSEI